jgi:3-hydroxyanthranilate 3,4-dioxygenase
MSALQINRKNQFLLFREMENLGAYAEFPLLRPEVDPQLHFSRNDREQPFFLVCEKDCVLAQVTGGATVLFRDASVASFRMDIGDYVYVPAGVAHRIRPECESIHIRYKARDAGREGVLWVCDHCGSQLHHAVWDTAEMLPQVGYARATREINVNEQLRKCGKCGTLHPAVDLAAYRWDDYAAAIAADAALPAAEPAR